MRKSIDTSHVMYVLPCTPIFNIDDTYSSLHKIFKLYHCQIPANGYKLNGCYCIICRQVPLVFPYIFVHTFSFKTTIETLAKQDKYCTCPGDVCGI